MPLLQARRLFAQLASGLRRAPWLALNVTLDISARVVRTRHRRLAANALRYVRFSRIRVTVFNIFYREATVLPVPWLPHNVPQVPTVTSPALLPSDRRVLPARLEHIA